MKADAGAAARAPNALTERIATVRAQVDEACRAAGRDPASVLVVGVTKKQPREVLLAAIEAGLTDLAENYVQEARAKFDALPVRKHFIGHIQTNKARAIAETFDVVQSVDRLEAGRALAKAARSTGRDLRALVQINISPVERFGAKPSEAADLARALRDEGLAIDGVMAIGPDTSDRRSIAGAFATAARTLEEVGGTTLSIGMSGDWQEAIACGSTLLRLGTALFGERV